MAELKKLHAIEYTGDTPQFIFKSGEDITMEPMRKGVHLIEQLTKS
jgi:hypothetical protein